MKKYDYDMSAVIGEKAPNLGIRMGQGAPTMIKSKIKLCFIFK